MNLSCMNYDEHMAEIEAEINTRVDVHSMSAVAHKWMAHNGTSNWANSYVDDKYVLGSLNAYKGLNMIATS